MKRFAFTFVNQSGCSTVATEITVIIDANDIMHAMQQIYDCYPAADWQQGCVIKQVVASILVNTRR